MPLNSVNSSRCHPEQNVLAARSPIGLAGKQTMRGLLSWIVCTVILLISSQSYAQLNVAMTIKNETGQAVTFKLTPVSCIYLTAPTSATTTGVSVAHGQSFDISFFRDALASACSGENGHFYLTSDYGPNAQHFHTTENGVWPVNSPGAFSGTLALVNIIPGVGNEYTWTMRDEDARLAKPADDRLKKPERHIAYDSGKWGAVGGGTLQTDTLIFARNGFLGAFYWECSGYETFHPQHMERLPNKNGRAYFMVTQSRGHAGYMYLVETYAGALDPNTDLVQPGVNGAAVGKIIWEDYYSGTEINRINPVGNWNHPAKMSLMGGVLVVVAQNWSEGAPFVDTCNHNTSNPYERGTSVDMLLFYDVRDPENPTYWGQMTAGQLGIPVSDIQNGPALEGTAQQIDSVNLTRDPIFGWYNLAVKGAGGAAYLRADSISPNRWDWDVSVASATLGSQQHGQDFTSYQWDPARSPVPTPAPGIRRNMQYDAFDTLIQYYDSNFVFSEMPSAQAHLLGIDDACGIGEERNCAKPPFRDGFLFQPADSVAGDSVFPTGDLPGNDVDWDADTLYVSRTGEPIIYGILSRAGPDGSQGEYNFDAHIYQTYDTRNAVSSRGPSPAVVTTVTNFYDNYIGTLREAINFGGKVSLATPIDRPRTDLRLNHGPLIVSLHDVEIDASALPNGLRIYATPGSQEPVFQVTHGNTLKMNNIERVVNDPLRPRLNPYLPWATSENGSWFESTSDSGVQSGVVKNSCMEPNKKLYRSCNAQDNLTTYLQTAVTGPGTLTFDWRVQSYLSDYLSFTITQDSNGTVLEPIAAISGGRNWLAVPATVAIPSGNHQLRWTFKKEGSNLGNIFDAAFVKDVTFTPPALAITSALTTSGTQGQSFYYAITASRPGFSNKPGDVYQYEAIGLPAGLYVDSSTGEIKGNPAEFSNPADFVVTVKATETPYVNLYSSSTAEATLVIHIDGATISAVNALDLPE